ncbi:hypothetical protein GCM10010251_52660 [Streptomyces aurantiogriseus]|uniref:Uncharacterized protein n=1 Tax=Streptomyces aurantiogriseus TaxID=66870 RepID=A0A918FEK8_9ACTN|nr:hypothetical protein GCM10010251_52660 [Streptomyces aurantiogriseus]
MSLVRRALPADAAEVLRLRQVMIDSLAPASGSTDWHIESLPVLRQRLAEPDGDFGAFVVDHPERPGALAALVVGTVEYRIGRAGNPHGTVGFVFSVATDPDAPPRSNALAREVPPSSRVRACVHGRAAGVVPGAGGSAGTPHGIRRGRAAVHLARLQAQA